MNYDLVLRFKVGRILAVSFCRIWQAAILCRRFLLRPCPSHATNLLQVLGCFLYVGCDRAACIPRRLACLRYTRFFFPYR